jgi:hypothetical protein
MRELLAQREMPLVTLMSQLGQRTLMSLVKRRARD